MVLLCPVLVIQGMIVKILRGSWKELYFFVRRLGLAIEGREMELLSFLASLEANRMKGDQLVEEYGGCS